MTDLRLIALDGEDLAIVSAHLQDAVLRVGDMTYLPSERRFAGIVNRFDWVASGGAKSRLQRRRAALRFERVLAAQVTGIDLKQRSEMLALLAVQFEPAGADDPGGFIELKFAGPGAVRLQVECVEAELRDLGAAWRAKSLPRHPDDRTDQ